MARLTASLLLITCSIAHGADSWSRLGEPLDANAGRGSTVVGFSGACCSPTGDIGLSWTRRYDDEHYQDVVCVVSDKGLRIIPLDTPGRRTPVGRTVQYCDGKWLTTCLPTVGPGPVELSIVSFSDAGVNQSVTAVRRQHWPGDIALFCGPSGTDLFWTESYFLKPDILMAFGNTERHRVMHCAEGRKPESVYERPGLPGLHESEYKVVKSRTGERHLLFDRSMRGARSEALMDVPVGKVRLPAQKVLDRGLNSRVVVTTADATNTGDSPDIVLFVGEEPDQDPSGLCTSQAPPQMRILQCEYADHTWSKPTVVAKSVSGGYSTFCAARTGGSRTGYVIGWRALDGTFEYSRNGEGRWSEVRRTGFEAGATNWLVTAPDGVVLITQRDGKLRTARLHLSH